MQRRMPTVDLGMKPMASPFAIDILFHEFEKFDPERAAAQCPWADRFVMGLPLAPWQREFKWTPEQSESFIESIWKGVYLGTYVITEADYVDGVDHVEIKPMTNMVLEGQQRLKSIELYITDQLPVKDIQGVPTLWSELDVVEQRRFRNTTFTRGILRETNEDKLRTFYDLMNFGGVRHEDHERAAKRSVRP